MKPSLSDNSPEVQLFDEYIWINSWCAYESGRVHIGLEESVIRKKIMSTNVGKNNLSSVTVSHFNANR